MATSGNFLTSDSGQGGGSYFSRLIFEWWRTGSGLSGSVGYHNISYTLKSWGGNASYWQYAYNNSMNVDGTGYSRGQTQVYGAGATTILSGSKTLYTDSAGNRSFGASAQAGIYTNAVNSSGSGSWAMDNIPINVQITNASGNQNDEFVNPQIWFNNPANYPAYVAIDFPDLGGYRTCVRTGMYQNSNPYTWTVTDAERNAIRAQMANVASTPMRFIVQNADGVPGQAITRTMSIVNSNPVFTTATFKDANSATVAITGNDQYMIQGYSQLEVDIASGDKATALKSATMSRYNMAIGSISQDVTYTTSAISQNLGVLGINANANLLVKAIDSRGLFTTVTLPVNVLPYVVPQVTATAQRVNNFETSTNFHIEGVISRLTVAGTDKNTVNSTSGVRYRYKKTTDVSWGSWINVASSVSAGNVTTTDFNVPTALDRNYAWNIQIEMTDKLNTTTSDIVLPVGIPIFRIGLDGHVYNNEVRMTTEDDTNVRELHYYGNTGFSLATSTFKVIKYGTKIKDSLGGYSTSTGLFTAPHTGWYSVSAIWLGEAVTGQYRYVFGVSVNANSIGEWRWMDGNGVGGGVAQLFGGTTDVFLTAGDTMNIEYWHSVGSTRTYATNTRKEQCALKIRYLGPAAAEI